MKFHDTLNEKLWENEELKPEVKDKLKEIAEAFIEFLEVNDDAIKDIVITGSCASYNYTKHSDIDLHLLVDFDKVHEDCPIVEGYLLSKKSEFNKNHDIFIYGIPVEVYAESIDNNNVHNGLYSLKQDKWIDKPKKLEPTDNDAAVEAKYKEIKDAIDICDDSEVASDLMKKIKNMRKSGLEEVGEFSTENLAFKKLRDNGDIGKLMALKKQEIDKQLSLESYKEDWSRGYDSLQWTKQSFWNKFGLNIKLVNSKEESAHIVIPNLTVTTNDTDNLEYLSTDLHLSDIDLIPGKEYILNGTCDIYIDGWNEGSSYKPSMKIYFNFPFGNHNLNIEEQEYRQPIPNNKKDMIEFLKEVLSEALNESELNFNSILIGNKKKDIDKQVSLESYNDNRQTQKRNTISEAKYEKILLCTSDSDSYFRVFLCKGDNDFKIATQNLWSGNLRYLKPYLSPKEAIDNLVKSMKRNFNPSDEFKFNDNEFSQYLKTKITELQDIKNSEEQWGLMSIGSYSMGGEYWQLDKTDKGFSVFRFVDGYKECYSRNQKSAEEALDKAVAKAGRQDGMYDSLSNIVENNNISEFYDNEYSKYFYTKAIELYNKMYPEHAVKNESIKDTQLSLESYNEEVNTNNINKMLAYYSKGSNPKQLVSSIKNNKEKCLDRYVIAKQLNWEECINEFEQQATSGNLCVTLEELQTALEENADLDIKDVIEQAEASENETQEYLKSLIGRSSFYLGSRKQKEQILSELTKAQLNSYVIIHSYFHQYAEGITGADREEYIFIPSNWTVDTIGWKNRQIPLDYLKNSNLKSHSKKGKSTGYGNIGQVISVWKVVTLQKAIETYDYWQRTYTDSIHFSTLENRLYKKCLRESIKESKSYNEDNESETSSDLYIVKVTAPSDVVNAYLVQHYSKRWNGKYDTEDVKHAKYVLNGYLVYDDETEECYLEPTLKLNPSFKDKITVKSKSEWQSIINDIKEGFKYSSYLTNCKFSIMPYPGKVISIDYWPSNSKGTWNLGELKRQLKRYGINVLDVIENTTYKYGAKKKYYTICVAESEADKLKKFTELNKAVADIEYYNPYENKNESLNEKYINVSSSIYIITEKELVNEMLEVAKTCKNIYEFEKTEIAQDCQLMAKIKRSKFTGWDLEDLVDNIRYSYEDAYIDTTLDEWVIEDNKVRTGSILVTSEDDYYYESTDKVLDKYGKEWQEATKALKDALKNKQSVSAKALSKSYKKYKITPATIISVAKQNAEYNTILNAQEGDAIITKNNKYNEALEERTYKGCKYTINHDGKYCDIRIYAPEGNSFKNGAEWYQTQSLHGKEDEKAKSIIDYEFEEPVYEDIDSLCDKIDTMNNDMSTMIKTLTTSSIQENFYNVLNDILDRAEK